jgi:hypothetical protein
MQTVTVQSNPVNGAGGMGVSVLTRWLETMPPQEIQTLAAVVAVQGGTPRPRGLVVPGL